MNLQSIQASNPAAFEVEFYKSIKDRSDKLVELFLASYFLCGLVVAFFYDTWLVALSVGSISILLYYVSKKMFPGSNVHHYVASLVVGIFMAQFIYQMHGLFEMHFFAFIGSALVITYQNWKVQLPLALFVVVHHAVFGYLQYLSYTTNSAEPLYFTQLNYMDLQTFIIHGLLATVVFFICGLWAYEMAKRTRSTIDNSKNMMTVAQANDSVAKNLEHAILLSQGMYTDKIEYAEGDLMGEALSTIQKTLSGK